jgi:seryl-tRNA synthetase
MTDLKLVVNEEDELDEKIVKKVNPDGSIKKVLDKKTRTRKATQTTGLSKSKRRLIAKKAAKTKKKDLGGQKKALRKRKKTNKKRKNLGL